MEDIEEITKRGFGEILDCFNAGVYITDTDRRIVFWNRKAEEITGYNRDEVVGRRCADNILSHTDKDGRPLCTTDLCPLHRAMVRQKPGEAPILVYAHSKEGDPLALSTDVAPVFDDGGNVIGGVEVFRDEGKNLREMELARTVQRQMLTRTLPTDDRVSFAVQYAPRELIGGDFYQVEQLTDDSFQMFLGDSAGHGPAAALYTSLVYALFLECRDLFGRPADLMKALNERACRRASGLGFFTAVCTVVDAASRSVTICSAGHPPLLVQRADPGEFEMLKLPQLPVGVHSEAGYKAASLALEPGDRLLAYTDGATDIPVGDEEMLGTDGLAALVSSHPPKGEHRLTELYEALLERCTAIEPEDDITLLSCLSI